MKQNGMPRTDDKSGRKYVFVCGLHRSGTSVLARNIGRLEDCTTFKNTGVIEDEGQFLQDVYPLVTDYGGAGVFGLDRRAHLTETSNLLTPENIARLRASWHRHWDNSKRICVEKTPANILITRFLQAAFPDSYFIVMKRHPVPVSLATQQWKVYVRPLYKLFDHWLRCHELFDEDQKYLKHVYELNYEDYVENQAKHHEQIAAFIGTRTLEAPMETSSQSALEWPDRRSPVAKSTMERATVNYSQKYFDQWHYMLTGSPFKAYYRHIAATYEPMFAKCGYSLLREVEISQTVMVGRGKISGTLFCRVADSGALIRRLWSRSRARTWLGRTRRRLKAILPESVLTRIRRVRQRATARRSRAGAF